MTESKHALLKRTQLKKGDVMTSVRTYESLIRREENEERLAVYRAGNHVLAPIYRKFQVDAETWYSWSQRRRDQHLVQLQKFVPNVENTFKKPANAGCKPGTQKHRSRVQPTYCSFRPSVRQWIAFQSTPQT